jgi:hypothetical protein
MQFYFTCFQICTTQKYKIAIHIQTLLKAIQKVLKAGEQVFMINM